MTSGHRRSYIDWARGIAVLLMIEAHTTDAWTRAASKATVGYRNANILGGFAAPLFLWLAGVAVVLAATRRAEKTGDRAAAVDSICRRGLEIFILAFLFRLQAFIISPGSAPVTLFRVDILNVMGPSIAMAGIVWGLGSSNGARVAAYSVLAIATAMLTPVVRLSPLADLLPTWVQWYVRPAGEHTTFTMFPWAGFVFAGGAVGVLLATAREARSEARLNAWLAAAGAAIIALGAYASTRPTIYRESSFWTSSPVWFAIRTGIMMVALAALYALAVAIRRENTKARKPNGLFRVLVISWQAPLEKLGQSSLFVYWIHVELVYGYASWLWRGRLPLWGAIAGYAAFCTLIYGVVLLRDYIVERRAAPAAPAYTAPT